MLKYCRSFLSDSIIENGFKRCSFDPFLLDNWPLHQGDTGHNLNNCTISWKCFPLRRLAGQGATPVQGAPGWLAPNPVRGMREPPSGSMQLQKLQFESVIYGNPEHSNWHQSFPTHIWLFLAQRGIPAGFIKTMQVEEMQNYKKYINNW